jgi:hypothetical protein
MSRVPLPLGEDVHPCLGSPMPNTLLGVVLLVFGATLSGCAVARPMERTAVLRRNKLTFRGRMVYDGDNGHIDWGNQTRTMKLGRFHQLIVAGLTMSLIWPHPRTSHRVSSMCAQKCSVAQQSYGMHMRLRVPSCIRMRVPSLYPHASANGECGYADKLDILPSAALTTSSFRSDSPSLKSRE